MDYKVGDKVVALENECNSVNIGMVGEVVGYVSERDGVDVFWGEGVGTLYMLLDEIAPLGENEQEDFDSVVATLGDIDFIFDEWFKAAEVTEEPIKSTGGPSKYYDFPFYKWNTVNDQLEYLADKVWGKYSVHFKDIFKAGFRWGGKDGTTEEYDAKKIVYSGLRLLIMIGGKKMATDYLKELLEDEQFKE